jgi:hypothetical protein
MTRPKIGEILRYLRTGGLFEVEKITNGFVILSARDGSTKIMTGEVGFDSVFAKVQAIEVLFNARGRRNGDAWG